MTTTRLTQRELRRFDGEAQKLLLWAQDQGATLKLTRKGHCLVYGPEGGSACVPPNLRLGNRSAQNARASVRRMLG